MEQWLRSCAKNRKVTGSIPAGVNGFFFDIKSFRSHYSPGVDSASKRNEYQAVRLTTMPPSCAVVMKSVNFNFLEPSRTALLCFYVSFGQHGSRRDKDAATTVDSEL